MPRHHKRCPTCRLLAVFDRNKKTRVGRLACNICDHYLMGSPVYVITIGFIGTVITAFDIIRIMKCKMPVRYSSRVRAAEVVPRDVERDLKLMTSILGIEHYTLIMLGAITEYPMLHTPWLLMQLCVIIVEIVVFFVRLFLDGLHVKRDEILSAIIAVLNWLQVETLYVAVMCFAAACLSFMALEVGARSPLGHSVTKSATFNAIFRRSYNLKIKILVTNVVTGLITTIMLALGDIYAVPYLYVPWLVNTMKGMIFFEGPALLGLTYVWLPDAGIPAGTFIVITLLLFAEELCLWFDVFASFRRCWIEYTERKSHEAVEPKLSLPEANKTFNKRGDQSLENAVAKAKLCDNTTPVPPVLDPTQNGVPVSVIRLRSTRSSSDGKARVNRCKMPRIAS